MSSVLFRFWWGRSGGVGSSFIPPLPPPVPDNALRLRGRHLRLRGRYLTLRQ